MRRLWIVALVVLGRMLVRGSGAAALPETGVTSALQAGDDATVLHGDARGAVHGVPSGDDGVAGKRTQDGRLSQGPSSADNVPGPNTGFTTYMELARDAGTATGNVSTAEITDATPAAPGSHISQRACQGPAGTRTTCPIEAKIAATPGLGSIAEQQVDNGFDLHLGGGRARYEQPLTAGDTTNVIDYAQTKGYTYVDSRDGHGRRDLARGRQEMTIKALSLLEADKDGFVLQVEAPRSTSASPCRRRLRPDRRDARVRQRDRRRVRRRVRQRDRRRVRQRDRRRVRRRVRQRDRRRADYQARHPDTLVIVTADHSHTSQMTYTTSQPATGTSYATVQTVDNTPIRVSYGTADTGTGATTSGSQHHTGAEVPVWASGPRAADIQGNQPDRHLRRPDQHARPGRHDADGACLRRGSRDARADHRRHADVRCLHAGRHARLRDDDGGQRGLQRRVTRARLWPI